MKNQLNRLVVVLLCGMFCSGCTALLTGGKKRPATTLALENPDEQTHCHSLTETAPYPQFVFNRPGLINGS